MSRLITPASIDAAPASARPLLDAVNRQIGSVPNLFRLVANSPAALELSGQDLWAFREDRIGVRFAYEWHDTDAQWFRNCGNENWAFDGERLMHTRLASINALPIAESERLYRCSAGRRPGDHADLTELSL